MSAFACTCERTCAHASRGVHMHMHALVSVHSCSHVCICRSNKHVVNCARSGRMCAMKVRATSVWSPVYELLACSQLLEIQAVHHFVRSDTQRAYKGARRRHVHTHRGVWRPSALPTFAPCVCNLVKYALSTVCNLRTMQMTLAHSHLTWLLPAHMHLCMACQFAGPPTSLDALPRL